MFEVQMKPTFRKSYGPTLAAKIEFVHIPPPDPEMVRMLRAMQTLELSHALPKRTSDASTSTASEVESSAKIAKANEAS